MTTETPIIPQPEEPAQLPAPDAATPAPAQPPEAAQPVSPEDALSALQRALLEAKALLACARLGVSEARAAYVLRLAALDGITDPLTEDDAIREAVQTVLTDLPELRGGGTGVSGAFRVPHAPAKDAFERGFEKQQ